MRDRFFFGPFMQYGLFFYNILHETHTHSVKPEGGHCGAQGVNTKPQVIDTHAIING